MKAILILFLHQKSQVAISKKCNTICWQELHRLDRKEFRSSEERKFLMVYSTNMLKLLRTAGKFAPKFLIFIFLQK